MASIPVPDDNSIKARELAERVIAVSQNSLLLSLRFMDTAIFRLKLKEAGRGLATDGKYIYYCSDYILRRYKEEPAQLTRDILHIVLHCIFRHVFVKDDTDPVFWDLASDIAVENIIASFGLSCTASKRAADQKAVLEELQSSLKSMNAEQICRYYKEKDLAEEQLSEIRDLFFSDDHSIWYDPLAGEEFDASLLAHGNEETNTENGPEGKAERTEGRDEDEAERPDAAPKNPAPSESELEWERVSKQVQMDLETFSKMRGDSAGDMVQQLKELNRERYDYAAFLRKFSVMGETVKINDDEFDHIFYTYGLKLLGNVPLIEPLEYKEQKRIREFVVAIDTSGSTRGPLVQRFLEKTHSILKSTESFFSKVNLHIIQCDADIREHVIITSQAEFDDYINDLTIKGFGGTDFRPVFKEVDRMVANKEFQHLKGIIYFTDGDGIYPEQKPNYEAAFVFIRNEYDDPKVPSWAIKLVLNDEEI